MQNNTKSQKVHVQNSN